MKACTCCGRENAGEAAHCRECGTEFPSTPTVAPAPEPEKPIPAPQFVDLSRLEGAFDFRDGFSRPDWKLIGDAIQSLEGADDRREAWREVALQWLEKLRGELGGSYHLTASCRCALLSALDKLAARRLLDFCETAAAAIREILREVAWESFDGLRVIIAFAEEDDYYQYVSGFCSEGEHPTSIGVHIQRGYPHVALLFETELRSAQTIVHELTHHCLSHLPIPRWLNEGVAQHLQKTIGEAYVPSSSQSASDAYWGMVSGWKPPLLCDDLAERHFGFWNQERIQGFWAGTSFREPGDSVQLSYNLAEILVHFLIEKGGDFLAFIRSAHADDAGQTAAWDCLGCCLGETVGTFLGPGDWRPQRKAIKACLKAAGWEGEESEETKV